MQKVEDMRRELTAMQGTMGGLDQRVRDQGVEAQGAIDRQTASMNVVVDHAKDKFGEIEVTVGSGASGSVANKKTAPSIKIREMQASKVGVKCTAANGPEIPNEGEKKLVGFNSTGIKTGMTMQVAKIKKVLASVSKITEAGNRVVFEGQGGHIEHCTMHKKTRS